VKDIEICLVPENSNKAFNELGKFLLKLDKNFKYNKNGSKGTSSSGTKDARLICSLQNPITGD
jgi:hypothetical protein